MLDDSHFLIYNSLISLLQCTRGFMNLDPKELFICWHNNCFAKLLFSLGSRLCFKFDIFEIVSI